MVEMGGVMYYELSEDFLMHFGVPGMRWGHRKAQPSSGTLSKRKQRKQKKAEVKQALKKNKQDYKDAKRKADKQYDEDTKEYDEAYAKLHEKYNRKQERYQQKNNTSSYSYKIEDKRDRAEQDLYDQYYDTISKAKTKKWASYRKAKKIYKDNKDRLVSSLKS